MKIKKAMKKIYGASLSSSEQKALEKEIQRQLGEYDQKNTKEIDAIVLWILHEEFGFGISRLKRFHDILTQRLKELSEYYEMDEKDQSLLCSVKLKSYGIDLENWGDGYL